MVLQIAVRVGIVRVAYTIAFFGSPQEQGKMRDMSKMPASVIVIKWFMKKEKHTVAQNVNRYYDA